MGKEAEESEGLTGGCEVTLQTHADKTNTSKS